jgi:glycosyltransferase involved in cell wall biosynthesis
MGPSLDACRRCFPGRAGTDHVLRELAVKGAFSGVDLILSPSEFLKGRFVAAGWDAARIRVLRNGIAEGQPAPHRAPLDGRRDRFAFFGHINRFKGSMVALEASSRLSRQGVAHELALHGGTAHPAGRVPGRLQGGAGGRARRAPPWPLRPPRGCRRESPLRTGS